jgi:hypothetical protein
MDRIAIRTTSACLAVAAALIVLKGIASLAAVESAAPTSLAVLPKVQVVAGPSRDRTDVVATGLDTNPQPPPR